MGTLSFGDFTGGKIVPGRNFRPPSISDLTELSRDNSWPQGPLMTVAVVDLSYARVGSCGGVRWAHREWELWRRVFVLVGMSWIHCLRSLRTCAPSSPKAEVCLAALFAEQRVLGRSRCLNSRDHCPVTATADISTVPGDIAGVATTDLMDTTFNQKKCEKSENRLLGVG